MAHILAKQTVEDYEDWKEAFDADRGNRLAAGCKNTEIYRNASDIQQVVLLFEWDEVRNATGYFDSDTYRNANARAGVVGAPEIIFLAKEG